MFRTKKWLVVAAVLVAAATAGILGAVGTHGRLAAAPAHAANHCTHYGPVRYAIDTNCTVKGSMWGWYDTASYGWRDANTISMSTTGQWELYYQLVGGASVMYTAAISTGNSIGAYGGAQAKADCQDYTGGHLGVCWTNWHD